MINDSLSHLCGDAAGKRLVQQLSFVAEIDKAKTVLRQTLLIDQSRNENDAEHSWHLAVMALLLHEYSANEVDLLKVIKMLLIHDIVEIDAGDTFAYDTIGHQDKSQREYEAAQRIFSILPPDQSEEIKGLWQEFESRKTSESRFAAALDRLQPLLHNYLTEGAAWRRHQVTKQQVIEFNQHMKDGSPELWEFASQLIEAAVEKGYLANPSGSSTSKDLY